MVMLANKLACACVLLPLVSALKASARDRTGAEPWRMLMDNKFDMQYYANITVSDQTLSAIMDTGSIEFVVISDKCNGPCGTDVERQFHSNSSASYRQGNLTMTLSFGSGDLMGGEAYDTVSLGPITMSEVPFWEVSDANMPVLQVSSFQAVVGLGPIAVGTHALRLGADNKDAYAVFLQRMGITRYSTCLLRAPHSPGFLTWNEDAHERSPNAFSSLRVVDPGYWMLKMTDLRLGDFKFCGGSCGAIIDSGTSLIGVPPGAYKDMAAEIDRLSDECSNPGALPNLQFKLDGIQHSLPPETYLAKVNGEPSSHVSKFFQTRGRKNAASTCQPAVMNVFMNSAVGPVFILGMPFLRYYFSVFQQASPETPATILTAEADSNCYPRTGDPEDEDLETTERVVSIRNIDASHIRLPGWLHRANSPQRLVEAVD